MNEQNLTRGKVLIADDDDDSRIMLSFLLEDEGWQVAEARDGKEALEKLVEEKPHVLVLDNRMPELTGAMVYEQLISKGINIPVVLITAFSDLDELASSLGIRYFLRKPIDFLEVLATIQLAYEESKN